MKILLTGYAGFLGGYLAENFEREGFNLRFLMNRTTKPRSEIIKGAEIVWGSVTDPDAVWEAVDGVDAVVHSAWSFSGPSTGRPTMNETGAKLLFNASRKANVEKFAFISSVAVYGMEKNSGAPVEEDRVPDESKLGNFIYPIEKLRIEQFLLTNVDNRIKLGIFRPGPIFDDKRPPIKKILKIRGRCIGLGMGTGKNRMPNIHASDVADAVGLWIKNSDKSMIYNVTPSDTHVVSDWYKNWGNRFDQSIDPFFIPVSFFRVANFGVNLLKKALKKGSGDINYAIACATRNMVYSNHALKADLQWTDKKTEEYTAFRERSFLFDAAENDLERN